MLFVIWPRPGLQYVTVYSLFMTHFNLEALFLDFLDNEKKSNKRSVIRDYGKSNIPRRNNEQNTRQ
jgi:hypothetical protein